MLLSKNYDFLFIHIYKNAGTSITKALKPFALNRMHLFINSVARKMGISVPFDPHPFHSHIKASEIINVMGKEWFKSFFSFAIVRNPWDWQVSQYKYMLKDVSHYQHDFVDNLGNFENYVNWRCANEVRLQKDFIYSSENELLVDYVGKYENLDSEFNKICSIIGISASLPKLRVSNTTPYQQLYSNETKKLVERTYKPDIDAFGYKFEY